MLLATTHLPHFPFFKRLTLDDKEVIHGFVSNFPSFTEFNFACMFAWDVSHPIMVSGLGENLVIKFIDFDTDTYYISLLGEDKIDESLDRIFRYCKNHQLEQAVHTVPSSTVKAILNKDKYQVVEDRDNHDYIYQTSNIAALNANKFRGKRNLVNRFQQKHGAVSVSCMLDLNDQNAVDQIYSVLEKWKPAISKSTNDLLIEFKAIQKALKNHQVLNLTAYGTYIEGSLEAFTIFEKVSQNTILIHFDKANREITGINEHMKHTFSKHLIDNDVELFNFSQDLGYEGLRTAKLSYHPAGFLKKYSIKPIDITSGRAKAHAKKLHGVHM